MPEAGSIMDFLRSLPERAERERTNPATFPCEGACGRALPVSYLLLAFQKLLCGACLEQEAKARTPKARPVA